MRVEAGEAWEEERDWWERRGHKEGDWSREYGQNR